MLDRNVGMPGTNGHYPSTGFHLVVCVKAVPKPEEVRVNQETRTLDRGSARTEINPSDMHALEMALALRDRYGGRVSLLSMGPPLFVPYLQVGLAMGADGAYLLSDRAFGGADTLATSYTLAKGIERLAQQMGNCDLILCGEESSDGATGQVPAGIAEWLGLPQVTFVTKVSLATSANGDGVRIAGDGMVVAQPDRAIQAEAPSIQVHRELRGGHELLHVPLPALLSVATGANVPRFLDPARWTWAKKAEVTVWDAPAVAADPALIGAPGSATQVAGLEQGGRSERRRHQIHGTSTETARALAALIRGALSIERGQNEREVERR
jgi:electron transfer flavoprotein beta subunit